MSDQETQKIVEGIVTAVGEYAERSFSDAASQVAERALLTDQRVAEITHRPRRPIASVTNLSVRRLGISEVIAEASAPGGPTTLDEAIAQASAQEPQR